MTVSVILITYFSITCIDKLQQRDTRTPRSVYSRTLDLPPFWCGPSLHFWPVGGGLCKVQTSQRLQGSWLLGPEE